jgi:hypothetical protein
MRTLISTAICLLTLGIVLSGPVGAQAPQHQVPPGTTCPGDQVVWVNTRSGVFHYQGERYFGSTSQGKFLCERDALREGDRATRNGQ